MDLQKFISTRPRLYHLTARSNVSLIAAAGRIDSATSLLEGAGQAAAVRQRRRKSITVGANGKMVHIRDQAPLHAGNMSLPAGWTFEDFVTHLNNHVFFWPGTLDGPIEYGRRHFERYAEEDNLVLVIDTAAMIDANPRPGIHFCRYNSGSPRCTGGNPSPRGPNTFVPAAAYQGNPSSVVEAVFPGGAILPPGRFVSVEPSSL
jgi:hypothetical protein